MIVSGPQNGVRKACQKLAPSARSSPETVAVMSLLELEKEVIQSSPGDTKQDTTKTNPTTRKNQAARHQGAEVTSVTWNSETACQSTTHHCLLVPSEEHIKARITTYAKMERIPLQYIFSPIEDLGLPRIKATEDQHWMPTMLFLMCVATGDMGDLWKFGTMTCQLTALPLILQQQGVQLLRATSRFTCLPPILVCIAVRFCLLFSFGCFFRSLWLKLPWVALYLGTWTVYFCYLTL